MPDHPPRMAEPPIPPALSPQEWASILSGGCVDRDKTTIPDWGDDEWTIIAFSEHVPDGIYVEEFWSQISKARAASMHIKPSIRHALAAICLYAQPFGFTQADVAMLKEQASAYAATVAGDSPSARKLRALASRLAALLPPTADVGTTP